MLTRPMATHSTMIRTEPCSPRRQVAEPAAPGAFHVARSTAGRTPHRDVPVEPLRRWRQRTAGRVPPPLAGAECWVLNVGCSFQLPVLAVSTALVRDCESIGTTISIGPKSARPAIWMSTRTATGRLVLMAVGVGRVPGVVPLRAVVAGKFQARDAAQHELVGHVRRGDRQQIPHDAAIQIPAGGGRDLAGVFNS